MRFDASWPAGRSEKSRAAAGPRGRGAERRSADDPAVRWMWIVACLASAGLWLQDCAAPWSMSEMTMDARLVAATQAATTLAVCLAVLVVGAVADTVDGRRLLYGTQLAACVVALAIGFLALAGALGPWVLLGLTAVLGVGHGALLGGLPAASPALAAGRAGVAVGGLHAAQLSSRQSGGAAIGGLVLATAGAAAAFFLTAAAFLAVALSLRRVPPARKVAPASPGRVFATIRVGLRTALRTPTVLRVMIRCAVLSLGAAALWSLLVVYVRDGLGLGVVSLGLLQTAAGLGGVAGALMLARVRRPVSAGAVICGLALLFAAAIVIMALVSSAAAAACGLALAGLAWFGIVVAFGLVVQRAVPELYRARTLGIYLAVVYLTTGIGCLVWGHVAAVVGVQPTWLIAAGVVAVGALVTSPLRLGRLPVRR